MKKVLSVLLTVILIISLTPLTNAVASAANVGNEYTMVSVPWDLINKCGHQAVSGPCQAYCWAYCRIILDNKSHTYYDYWTGKMATAPSAAKYTSQSAKMTSKQILLETICSNVDLGRPVVVRVKGSKAFHYVVAIGYRANCDRNNLSESDILILDPANKAIKSSAGAKETYSYLSSCTLSQAADGCYGCWTTISGGTNTVTAPNNSGPNIPVGKSSKPVVAVDGKSATVSWDYSGNVTHYDVYLVQSPWRWEDIKYYLSTSSTSCTFENITPGDYRAFVIVRPNADTAQSEWADFTISTQEPIKPPIPDGVYSLAPQCAPNFRLDVASGSTENKANIQIYQNNNTVAQQFEFTYVGDGYYSIAAKVSGKCLDVQEGKKTSGTNIWQYTPNLTDAQMWILEDAGDGYYYIVPKLNTSLCLDVYSAKSENRTNVQVYTRNQSSAQKWMLIPLDATSKETPAVTPSNSGPWGPWSEWSTSYVEESSTRRVESRQVKVSDEHTEYRYGRFVDSTGTKVCWCKRYLESWDSVSGSATLQYSDWSANRYGANGKHWGCGFCNGDHIGVDFTSADGRAWWAQYELSDGYYYWEETKTVEAQYETQYRYQDWMILA